MTVKRFIAPTAREALRRVKEELGADAIVVSNKAVPGGVEITAMSADSLDALSHRRTSAEHPAQLRRRSSKPARPADRRPAARRRLRGRLHGQPVRRRRACARLPFRRLATPSAAPSPPAAMDDRPRAAAVAVAPGTTDAVAAQVAATLRSAAAAARWRAPQASPVAEPQVGQLMAEMQSIKSLLERQLAGFAWGEMSRQNPAQAHAAGRAARCRILQRTGPAAGRRDAAGDCRPPTAASGWRAPINRRLRTLAGDNDIIDRGGVFALVGPTGVGKTTTTAKLAARCVVRYGADKLALLTTDGYRIGAHEQLRIYGRILGVPVHVVRDSEDLRRTLVDLRDKHMILIDTVGMSQRDRMVAEQAAMLTRAGEVQAPAAAQRRQPRRYARRRGARLLPARIWPAASSPRWTRRHRWRPALDAVVRHGLLLAYVANGQRVPEDLHLPNRSYLLHRAFKLPAEGSPHRLHERRGRPGDGHAARRGDSTLGVSLG